MNMEITTARAQLKYLRIAPRKVRFVASSVSGMSVNEAEAQLLMQPRRSSGPLLKLLRSAVANAKAVKLNPEKLYIKTFTVDNGPFLKRFMPRARGSASEIQKKMSHVTIVLAEKEVRTPRFTIKVVKKAKKPEDGAKKTKKAVSTKEDKQYVEKPRGGVMQRVFKRKAPASGD